jgi:hypothetical protein
VKPVNKPQSLGKILGNSGHLRGLIQQAQHNTEVLLEVRALMPDALRSHCHAAHIQDQQLVLFTDSPAWVMRLRFCSTQILTGLRATRPNLRGVRVRVQLPQRQTRQAKRRSKLSEDARRHLQEAAAGLENPALAAALVRLSRTR